MSRLEEALRRAGTNVAEPESFHQSSAKALDWFAPNDASATPEEGELPPGPAPVQAAEQAQEAVAEEPAPIAAMPPRDPIVRGPSALDTFGPADTPASKAPVVIRSDRAHRLIVSAEAQPVAVEQYRRIAAVLHHVQRDRGVKVVMVSSAIPGEGKTLTASNLALTISESYRRSVLLIDADLRRPMVHETFGVSVVNGLSAVLDSLTDVQPDLVQVTPYLTVLPAGTPTADPLSGLTSQRMKRLVGDARERFDWVVIDTPPVGVLSDANLLGAMVDAALLVIGAGQTPLKIIQDAVNALGRERILGVVLNRVEEKSISGHYGGYGYGYGYSTRKGSAPA